MRIYVSGPYSAATEGGKLDNALNAMRYGYCLLEAGHAPVIPHLSHWFDQYLWYAGLEWDDYMKWDLELLGGCEALYFIGHSPGADMELAEAERLGLPIFRSLEEVPSANEV